MNDDHPDDNKPIPFAPARVSPIDGRPLDALPLVAPPVDWSKIAPDPRLEALEASEDVTDAIELLLDSEQCRVCGHYHGGQGECVTRHAFVPRSECWTCVQSGEAYR